jgi:hypothetical protein
MEGKRATGAESGWLFKGSKVLGAIYVCRSGRLINHNNNNKGRKDERYA